VPFHHSVIITGLVVGDPSCRIGRRLRHSWYIPNMKLFRRKPRPKALDTIVQENIAKAFAERRAEREKMEQERIKGSE
jgi:hypothetical protein